MKCLSNENYPGSLCVTMEQWNNDVVKTIKNLFIGRTNTTSIQFFRYLFVGGSSALVDLGVFTLLVKYVGMDKYSAAFVGYMTGLTWNYLTSLLWIFESKHNRAREIMTVILIAIGGLLWTWLLLYLMVDIGNLDPVIAKAISQILVLIWNFGMRKVAVFD